MIDECPFFTFGRGQVPLAWIGGGLILDSGEAENTFVFRCQDRFLAYTSMLGLRSIVLVLDDCHRLQYEQLVAALDLELRYLAELYGLPLPRVPPPLFVQCDLQRLSLTATGSFHAAATALAEAGQSVYFVANQVSPTASRMMGELSLMLRACGVRVEFDARECDAVGTLALRWHNKARFLVLRDELDQHGGPPWIDSAVVAAEEYAARPDWATVSEQARKCWRLAACPQQLFVKSAQDSSGNISAILSRDTDSCAAAAFLADVRRWLLTENFAAPSFVQELREECELAPSLRHVRFDDHVLAALRLRQAQRRSGISLIVQPVLHPGAAAQQGPASVGVSVLIEEDGTCRLLAVNAQLYRDAQRRQFLGLWLDDRLLEQAAVARLADQCLSAAAVLAARGYRGPVNFDACLGPEGRYWFTGDCNPRLSALYVPWAVRAWLRTCDVAVHSVISFGYRGEFAIREVPAVLDAWAGAGLLFSPRAAGGMLVLPNLVRLDGHDVLAINLDVVQARQALERMRHLAPDSVPAYLKAIHG